MEKHSQVGIVSDHCSSQDRPNNSLVRVASRIPLMLRIRHCVECPRCLTRYLIPASPYRNGSYLIPTIKGSLDEYALYCSCRRGSLSTLWRWSEVKTCEVSNAAYERGYGSPDEITPIHHQPQEAWSFDVSKYLSDLRSAERRRSPR